MADRITPELFHHLVELAALELDEEEAEYLRQELNNQLTAIDQLAAIPIPEGLALTSHGVPYTAETTPDVRQDEWIPCEDVDAILEQAPELEDGYIVVPEIPHEELS